MNAPLRIFVSLSYLMFISLSCFSQDSLYRKLNDGVIIYPSQPIGGGKAVMLRVISDNIIRITVSPEKEFPSVASLMTNYTRNVAGQWEFIPNNSNNLELITKSLIAKVNAVTGRLIFQNTQGNEILAEGQERTLTSAVAEGEKTYSIHQEFQTSSDDAWYGLGQHQDGLMNYRGYQVFLFQNNTEVAVPFLVSKKNYGILWDNNSITRAGDTRDYKELSSLKLFSKNDEPGWLTATYYNDRNNTKDILMQRAESDIKYQYLNDSKLHLPAEFKPSTGMIVWEGNIASGFNGIHKLRLTYGGYMKVWIDGKLLLDRWRQSWNPGSAILDISLEKGKLLPLRIEWIPDGGESYASAKWMEPLDRNRENSFGFLSEAGKHEDYYFIYGKNMDEVIGGYRFLTGKAVMFPIWAFGFWQSRERYKTQDEVLNTMEEFRKRKIPLDNIVQDWFYWKEDQWGSQEFDASRFPSPDSMIAKLHTKYNAHFMISVWPKFYEGVKTYNDFNARGWLYKRNIADRQRDWVGKGYVSTFYDVFNEGAQKGFWDIIHNNLYKKGVDAWWMDASEPDILSNVGPEQRKQQMYPLAAGLTSEYLNAYPLMNAKGIYEGQRSADPGKRVFILTRSAFPGLQRYAAATWSGDISSRWHDMKLQIAAGINFSMSGLPYWTMDIGGFAVERRYEHPDSANLEEWREMNARWQQFGCFVPLFRSHGQFPFREMYNVAPDAHPCYQSMLYYDKLRYRLLPYIYSMAGQAYRQNYTIMRGLVMDFAGDKNVDNIADEYMFGSSLLVCPVYLYKQRTKELYLPAGQVWYNLYSGKYANGGQTITEEVPYERIPVFVKGGSIVPFGPALQYTNEKKADTITLYVYAGKDGEFELYEDEGTNYNYENGGFATIGFHYSDSDRKLMIGKREGQFPGMLINRYFRVKFVSKEKPLSLELEKKEGVLIKYNGNAQTLSLK